MVRLIRITAVFGALWSLLVTGVLWLIGSAFSLTDRFNGPHTRTLAVISLLEVCLLVTLTQTYRLRTWTCAALLCWFIVASALLTRPFGLSGWLGNLVFLLCILAPVTLTTLLLALRVLAARPPGP